MYRIVKLSRVGISYLLVTRYLLPLLPLMPFIELLLSTGASNFLLQVLYVCEFISQLEFNTQASKRLSATADAVFGYGELRLLLVRTLLLVLILFSI